MSLICKLSLVLLVSSTSAIPLTRNHIPKSSDIVEATEAINYRLPNNVKPSRYTIQLEPNIVPGDFTFEGKSSIKITVAAATNEIVLHAKDLTIDDNYTSLTGEKLFANDLTITSSLENTTDFLRLKLSASIAAGVYTLNLKYKGLLHDDLNGFYRSSYVNGQGQMVWLATTQFEPTWARRAFPCFDEPALKAQFKISIKHMDNYTAISNMPAVSQSRPINDLSKWWTHFAVTPPMSTYLVAFVVSDFKYLSNNDGSFRIYSRENAIHTGAYALGVGQKELKHLEYYAGSKHVIPKMDNFAIPQFRAGAMENWGIVTYRESALLFKENVTAPANKQGIATVMSHEFAHQWFGNLVSPLWWDWVWLNEGFANYFEYFTTDKVETTWRLMDQFVIKNLQRTAFMADDNENQHAMDARVNSPGEISSIFDSISYSKAGCVIRMISHVLGESVFQTGLTNYLTKMKYSAASSDDLFDALASVSTTIPDMKKTLISWARQPGYPVLTVIRDYESERATISQKRFLTKKTKVPKERWFIPINYVIEDKPDFQDTKATNWLITENDTIAIAGSRNDKWIIFNKQQTGYYRVNYDPQNWKLIGEDLKDPNNTKIHTLNRAQLLDDAFHLTEAGELPDHTTFLEITEYLRYEDNYVPWYAAYRSFAVLDKALANTEKYDIFKLYIRRLTEKLEKTVGYSETAQDDHITKLNRLNAVKLACTMGSAKCLAATHDQLVQHVIGSHKLSADLQSVVLCAGMRKANSTIWEKTYDLTARMSNETTERITLVSALGCSSDANILNSYLARTLLVESNFSRNDVVKAVYSGNVAGINVAFDFIRDNLKTILEADGNSSSILDYLNEIGSRLTTAAQIEKLKKLINSLRTEERLMTMADALEAAALVSANVNIEWLKKYETPISSFLISQKLINDNISTMEQPY